MSMSIYLTDYKIMNANASEDDTDAEKYLIKIEEEVDDFELPDELELKSNNVFLNDN